MSALMDLLLIVGLLSGLFAILGALADSWERRDAYQRNHPRRWDR